jgi:hypothetical protein
MVCWCTSTRLPVRVKEAIEVSFCEGATPPAVLLYFFFELELPTE